jgi:hypothetical protein
MNLLCSSPFFCRDHNVTAIVQRTFNRVSMVKNVTLTCCRASCDLRNIRVIMCATSALTALGVSPFRIWHDSKISIIAYAFERIPR